ncbi:MAG TPA: hypothetical protein DHW34_04310, partial [Actinobacteria bacterium]|nr:hypothetical protein [Actinomycetota bacterium]
AGSSLDHPAGGGRLRTVRSAELQIAEREGSPVVSELVVTNNSPDRVLLLEGDLLEGGWQNRVVSEPVIIAAGASAVVPVNCVERSRWHGQATHSSRGRKVGPRVRERLDRDRGDRQSAVWESVAQYASTLTPSLTESYLDYLDTGFTLEEAEVPPVLAGQTGVMIGIAGHPVMLEVFTTHQEFALAYEHIIKAAITDSIGGQVIATPSRRARRFLAGLETSLMEQSLSLSGGTALKAEPRNEVVYASVSAVECDEKLVHLIALNRRHNLLAEAI